MTTLFLFDDLVDPDEAVNLRGPVVLYPLTGDSSKVELIRKCLENRSDGSVSVLDPAGEIDREIAEVRSAIAAWSARFGREFIWGRTLKQWFLLPGERVSAWWFGLISEKNTFKTNAFFNMARLAAVRNALARDEYQAAAISVGERHWARALSRTATRSGLPVVKIKTLRPVSWKERTKYVLDGLGIWGQLGYGFFAFLRFLYRGLKARHALKPLPFRRPRPSAQLLISYYPAADSKALDEGLFKSKYYGPLPDKMEDWDQPVDYILMHVGIGGTSFSQAVDQVREFVANGQNVSFLEEYLPVTTWVYCLAVWLRQAFIAYLLCPRAERAMAAPPSSIDGLPFMRLLWRRSFYGSPGAEGILFYQAWKKAVQAASGVENIIYSMEWHAWEKALVAAAGTEGLRTIGFQHGAVSVNYFHFYYDPSETERTGRRTELPLPEVVALTGQAIIDQLAGCRLPGVIPVEALRFLYVRHLLDREVPAKPEKPVLLVAGSISFAETKTLTAMVCQAFPRADGLEIWFKAHPMCPFEQVFQDMGVDAASAGYQIKGGGITDSLAVATVVFVPTSTVSIEALAFGCEVILPIVPDVMMMNPLAGFDDYYHTVHNGSELGRVVSGLIAGQGCKDKSKYRGFVRDYWLTDPELPRWKTLLSGKAVITHD